MQEPSSYRCSFQFRNPFPQRDEGGLGPANRPQAGGGNAEELLRAAAPFWRRVPQPGRDQAVLAEAIEREIHRGVRDRTAGGLLDFAGDGHAVGLVPDAKHGQHDHQLEVGEKAPAHLVAHYEESHPNWQLGSAVTTYSTSGVPGAHPWPRRHLEPLNPSEPPEP